MKATKHGRPGLFAQLLGFSKSAAEEPEEDKDKAEDEDEEAGAEEGGDDDKDKDKAEDEDGAAGEDDDKDKDDEKAKAARAERRRCARIIAHGIKTGAVEQAGVLAFDSDLTASAAVATLDAMAAVSPGAHGRGRLGQRMGTVPEPKVGNGGSGAPGADTAEGLAAAMVGAYGKAIGKP
jgi:hypothetical protein